jgi:hypothetical protein
MNSPRWGGGIYDDYTHVAGASVAESAQSPLAPPA